QLIRPDDRWCSGEEPTERVVERLDHDPGEDRSGSEYDERHEHHPRRLMGVSACLRRDSFLAPECQEVRPECIESGQAGCHQSQDEHEPIHADIWRLTERGRMKTVNDRVLAPEPGQQW